MIDLKLVVLAICFNHYFGYPNGIQDNMPHLSILPFELSVDNDLHGLVCSVGQTFLLGYFDFFLKIPQQNIYTMLVVEPNYLPIS